MAGDYINRVKIEARSESMTKWAGRLEDEFNLDQVGGSPTERMEGVINQIKDRLQLSPQDAMTLNTLIASAYNIGAQNGFARALKNVENGLITTRKVPNEERWVVYSNSRQYQITEKLPSLSGQELKETVYINLAEHGFE